MPERYTTLKGVQRYGEQHLSSELEDGVVKFFEWGLLEAGAFFNVEIPTSGIYGGNAHRLRLVDDPNYTKGQVWEGFRSNWVWESGVFSDDPPINISGVHINGTFYATYSHHPNYNASYSHIIDYPNGRVIFDSPITDSSVVTTEYSYRWVKFIYANNEPWFRQLQFDSIRSDNPDFLQTGSGDWSQLAQTRTQMPVVAVEVVPRRRFKGYQLGGGQYVWTDILFHVMAENESERDKLVDIISMQNDKVIYLFNSDRLAKESRMPLDYRGMFSEHAQASGALGYPAYVKDSGQPEVGGGYRTRSMIFTKVSPEDAYSVHRNLHMGTVRTSTEVVLPGI